MFPKDLPPTPSTLVVKPQHPSEKWDCMVWIGDLQMDRSGGKIWSEENGAVVRIKTMIYR